MKAIRVFGRLDQLNVRPNSVERLFAVCKANGW